MNSAATISLAVLASLPSAFGQNIYPMCGMGTNVNHCIAQPGANGLVFALPYTSTVEQNMWDWQPFNCQYNGQMHLNPGGINTVTGATGSCNPDYLAYRSVPDGSGIALRGNMYSGDWPKDNSDLAQGISAHGALGAKCATTRMASGNNLLGESTQLFSPAGLAKTAGGTFSGLYTYQWSQMITEVHSCWNFTMHSLNGPGYDLAYLTDPVTCLGQWTLVLISPTAQTTLKSVPIPVTPLSDIMYDGTVGSWETWTFQYCVGCTYNGKTYAAGTGFVSASLNGATTVGNGFASMDLLVATEGYDIKLGVTTITENCETADFSFFLKNFVCYEGNSIPASVTADLAAFVDPLPHSVPGAIKTYPVTQFALYPTFPTREADGALFLGNPANVGNTISPTAATSASSNPTSSDPSATSSTAVNNVQTSSSSIPSSSSSSGNVQQANLRGSATGNSIIAASLVIFVVTLLFANKN